MLQAEESMRDGYHPKMLLYALDELFYIYAQIKNSHSDDKVVLAYEILCISANRCTDQHNGIEKWAYSIPYPSSTLRTPDISSASHGPCTTVPYLWAHSPNFWVLIPGVPCWLGCSDTFTGAAMMRPIARHRC